MTQWNNVWNNVTIPSNLYVCQSEKSYKFKLPRHSLYGGYSIWVSKKLILFFEGDYILLYKDNFTFRIIKYGKGKYNWKDILDEKEISAEELAETFGYVEPVIYKPPILEPLEGVTILDELRDD